MKLDTKKVTLENVDAQVCSDWLKGELRILLRKELALAVASKELDWYANGGLVYSVFEKKECPTFSTNEAKRAREALTEIGKILEGK